MIAKIPQDKQNPPILPPQVRFFAGSMRRNSWSEIVYRELGSSDDV